MPPVLRAALWWLVPLAALAAVIGWETDWGGAIDKRPEPPAAIEAKPVVASLLPEYTIAGGPDARTEMVQRTLFNPTRRPAPVAAQADVGRLQRGQFALTGTMLVDGKSTAFLREVAGNKARRVQAGEKINGMLVADVRPDRVRLTLGDESEELMLKVATNPRPTAPPPAVAQAPPQPAGVQPAGVLPTTAAAPPPPAGTTDAAQTLAERRRAARAARSCGGCGSPAGRSSCRHHRSDSAAPAAAADPRWEQLDQRYRERTAVPNRANAP